MSRIFGPLRQMGYVVRDIESAMDHWINVCGIGPWYYAERISLTTFHYQGKPHDLHMSVAMANSGEMQIELIQQRNDVPSMYRDFLRAGGEGLQHWSSWPENYSELLERAIRNGWSIGQEGDSVRGPFVYFSNEGHPGTIIEMSELTPTRRQIFDGVRQAAVDWDGSKPIREMATLITPG